MLIFIVGLCVHDTFAKHVSISPDCFAFPEVDAGCTVTRSMDADDKVETKASGEHLWLHSFRLYCSAASIVGWFSKGLGWIEVSSTNYENLPCRIYADDSETSLAHYPLIFI